MDHNFLAGFLAGGAIMAMLWFAGWLDWPSAWVDRQLTRMIQAMLMREE